MRRINLTSGLVTTLAGDTTSLVGSSNQGHSDGLGSDTSFDAPFGIAMNPLGTFAIVVSADCAHSSFFVACVPLCGLRTMAWFRETGGVG